MDTTHYEKIEGCGEERPGSKTRQLWAGKERHAGNARRRVAYQKNTVGPVSQ